MDKKLQIAKRLLKDQKEELRSAQDFIDVAEEKYIGKSLEQEITRWTEYKEEREVYIEALQDYVDLIESQIKQEEEHDAEEAESERLADNEQEHAQEMRAQYEEELRSEGTDN
jgi:uncharacterized FlgJ-related protein